MRIVTGNKINEFFGLISELFVGKIKVLKSIEEVEASTNEEDVMGAAAGKELNNKLASGRVELVVMSDGKLGYKLDGADTVIPFIKAVPLSLMQVFQKAHNTNNTTFAYTVLSDVRTLLIQYLVTLGDKPDNLPTVTINGVTQNGFKSRYISMTSPAPCLMYYIVVNDLKKDDTIVMTSPYWGTNSYDLQLWGC